MTYPLPHNATFHAFKVSGKWYATDRGHAPRALFDASSNSASRRRQIIVEANGGRYPGLGSRGDGMVFVFFLDDAVDYGYPMMIRPDAS